MHYRITAAADYLRAELFNRETVEETREFLQDVAAAAVRHQRWHILMSIRSSRPVFKLEQHGFLDFFKKLGTQSRYSIAVLGDTEELQISHHYAELLAQQHGFNIKSFREEAAALQWLRAA